MKKLVAYVAIVVDTQDEAEASDSIAEALRASCDDEDSLLLDWQHVDPANLFETIQKFEYENWKVPQRILHGV